MALTMTRTRTQTALTKLVELVANVHGELEKVERLLAESKEVAVSGRRGASEAGLRAAALERRRQVLLTQRESLHATVGRFDAELDPTCIGSSQEWLKQYGRGGGKAAQVRYLRSLGTAP
jgi:hypothetical protein